MTFNLTVLRGMFVNVKFWTEAKILTHQKVLRAVSLCLKPIGITALKPKVKKRRVAGLNPTQCIDVSPCSLSSVCVDLLQWIRFVRRVLPKVKKKKLDLKIMRWN